MAMTPEAKVKKQIRAVLDAHGAYYAMPVTGGFGNSGTPDFLVCYKGWFLGIEAKAGKGKTTALQDAALRKIQLAGGVPLVINETNIRDVETSLHILDDMEVIRHARND